MTEKKDKKEKKGKKEKKSSGFIGIKGVFGGGGKKSKKSKKKVTIDDSSELSTDTGSNAAASATTNSKQPVVDKYDQQKEDPYGYEMELQAEIDRDTAARNKPTKPSTPVAAAPTPARQIEPAHDATKQQIAKPRSSSLQVILLLMEPNTRRFEFLQFEFDSTNATVKNILSQIPMSVTEHEIRRVSFRGVCDKNAKERKPFSRLSEFCSNMDVLIGLPYDLSATNMYRLARPILSDEKVLTMLSRAGVGKL